MSWWNKRGSEMTISTIIILILIVVAGVLIFIAYKDKLGDLFRL